MKVKSCQFLLKSFAEKDEPACTQTYQIDTRINCLPKQVGLDDTAVSQNVLQQVAKLMQY